MSMMSSAASRNSTCSIGARRCSLVHNLRPFASADNSPVSSTGEKPRSADDYLPLSQSLDCCPTEDSAVTRLGPCDVSSLPECQQQIPAITSSATTQDQSNLETKCPGISRSSSSDQQQKSEDKIEPNNNSRDVTDGTSEDDKLNWSQFHITKISYPYDPSEHEDDDEDEVEDEVVSLKKIAQACPRQQCVQSTTSSLFNLVPWMDNSCHLLRGFRYTVGGILLVAALFSLIVTFMPGQATAQCRATSWQSWHSLEELLQPYFSLQRRMPPAT